MKCWMIFLPCGLHSDSLLNFTCVSRMSMMTHTVCTYSTCHIISLVSTEHQRQHIQYSLENFTCKSKCLWHTSTYSTHHIIVLVGTEHQWQCVQYSLQNFICESKCQWPHVQHVKYSPQYFICELGMSMTTYTYVQHVQYSLHN